MPSFRHVLILLDNSLRSGAELVTLSRSFSLLCLCHRIACDLLVPVVCSSARTSLPGAPLRCTRAHFSPHQHLQCSPHSTIHYHLSSPNTFKSNPPTLYLPLSPHHHLLLPAAQLHRLLSRQTLHLKHHPNHQAATRTNRDFLTVAQVVDPDFEAVAAGAGVVVELESGVEGHVLLLVGVAVRWW